MTLKSYEERIHYRVAMRAFSASNAQYERVNDNLQLNEKFSSGFSGMVQLPQGGQVAATAATRDQTKFSTHAHEQAKFRTGRVRSFAEPVPFRPVASPPIDSGRARNHPTVSRSQPATSLNQPAVSRNQPAAAHDHTAAHNHPATLESLVDIDMSSTLAKRGSASSAGTRTTVSASTTTMESYATANTTATVGSYATANTSASTDTTRGTNTSGTTNTRTMNTTRTLTRTGTTNTTSTADELISAHIPTIRPVTSSPVPQVQTLNRRGGLNQAAGSYSYGGARAKLRGRARVSFGGSLVASESKQDGGQGKAIGGEVVENGREVVKDGGQVAKNGGQAITSGQPKTKQSSPLRLVTPGPSNESLEDSDCGYRASSEMCRESVASAGTQAEVGSSSTPESGITVSGGRGGSQEQGNAGQGNGYAAPLGYSKRRPTTPNVNSNGRTRCGGGIGTDQVDYKVNVIEDRRASIRPITSPNSKVQDCGAASKTAAGVPPTTTRSNSNSSDPFSSSSPDHTPNGTLSQSHPNSPSQKFPPAVRPCTQGSIRQPIIQPLALQPRFTSSLSSSSALELVDELLEERSDCLRLAQLNKAYIREIDCQLFRLKELLERKGYAYGLFRLERELEDVGECLSL
ncbi:hypothetical protein CC2G_006902 [Coprinopsis cinerea AmutBmut pab1-1]|nr:hypothetical protein CC2G_006902 [Coprinopsis cinerea AmutBmut pab1-1]